MFYKYLNLVNKLLESKTYKLLKMVGSLSFQFLLKEHLFIYFFFYVFSK